MRSIRFLRFLSITASLLCVWPGIADGQGVDAANSWLPLAGVRLADNGDLVGWQVNDLGVSAFELVEHGERLLVLRLLLGNRDISEQFTWRRLPISQGSLGQFVGTHTDLAIEIRRSYQSGVDPGTVVHQVQVATQSGVLPADFRVRLKMLPSLRKHTPDDSSLGSIFYGYGRTFTASPNADEMFEPVHQAREASAAALVVRHIAVVVTPLIVGNEGLMANPESGVILELNNGQYPSIHRQLLEVVELRGAALGDSSYRSFLYSDMWGPLQGLARLIEWVLQILTDLVSNSGLAIVIFALLLRLVLLPLGLWSIRQQRKFSGIQQQMKPKIEQIEQTLRGAEKSERIIETYKEHGISPFSGLKGSIGLFVQLPILIAFFAVTTESALFRDVPFLWVSDLSLPDRAFALSFSIPGLGGYVNLLPILLGMISIFAALIQARSAGFGAAGSPRPGLLLALVFVVFFYSCAAALVLYWMVINVAQIFESQYVTRTTPMPGCGN